MAKDKIHAVFIRENGRPELQALCGRDSASILPAQRTIDPTIVTCSRCRDSRRWTMFFCAALNR